ncbi:MAG: phosphatase PAP2 family protein, partial [Lactococcus cremoris]
AALFLPFFADRKNLKGQKILAYSGLIFTLLMMAARVRIGAHFLSDTTMSLIIAALVTFVATKAIGYSFIEEDSLN